LRFWLNRCSSASQSCVSGDDTALMKELGTRLSHPAVFALGDAAAPAYRSRVPMQMGAFTATVTGAHAADCVYDVLRGRQPRRLSFAYYGQAIALGRKDVIGFNRNARRHLSDRHRRCLLEHLCKMALVVGREVEDDDVGGAARLIDVREELLQRGDAARGRAEAYDRRGFRGAAVERSRLVVNTIRHPGNPPSRAYYSVG